ncbi:putative Homeobox-like domain superfamily, myb-like transcription factor [Arabidopsis thaliana]
MTESINLNRSESESDNNTDDVTPIFAIDDSAKGYVSLNRRNDVQCQHRWLKVLDPSLQKGACKKEEDELLSELVKNYICNYVYIYF